ncbi:putative conserved hypothetical protein, partial [Colletotrichum sublineola]
AYLHESRDGEIVTFFIPHFDDPASLSAETALRSIIRQSLDTVRLSSHWEARLTDLNRKRSSKLDELTSLLRQKIDESKTFYIFIDALDEFEPVERRALLVSLASVVSGSCLRVFISSRESLSGELKERIPSIRMISMASTEARTDIAAFVRETLEERQQNEDLMVQDKSIIDDIKHALINHADGMFLWVAFLLDEICAQNCDDDIRNAIGRLPKNLTEVLKRALHRIIRRQKSPISIKAFQWIAIAKRPLTLDELREAMSIEILQPSLNPGQLVNGIHQLPTWCENLIRVDEESRTTEFAHKAVYEFIVRGLSGPEFTQFHFTPKDADHNAGEVCVTYLNFSDFVTTVAQRPKPVKIDPPTMAHSALQNSWKLPKSFSSAITMSRKNVQAKSDLVEILATYNRSDNAGSINMLQDSYPFLKYASVHWISHHYSIQQSYLLDMDQQEPLALNSAIWPWSLANRHFAVIQLLGILGKINSADEADSLQISAAEGDKELVGALLDVHRSTNLSRFNEMATAALERASHYGQIEIVEWLISEGFNANAPSTLISQRWNALHAASQGGHIEVVESLLSAGAYVNTTDCYEQTALFLASQGGHLKVVERLLIAGADANAGLKYPGARSALVVASEGGYVEVVEQLLSAGAIVNGDGPTALIAASKGGYIRVVECLLSAGAVNTRWNGRNALVAASEGGHLEVIECLLSAGAIVNGDGPTALIAASKGGHLEVIERLLSAGANVNATNRYGWTALQEASEGGYLEVVDRLLSAGADVDAADRYR